MNELLFPIVAIVKIACQIIAAYGAFACASAFEPGDRTRRSWRLLGTAMVLFAGGQLVLAWWHVVLRTQAPFPSPADACFVPATLVLAAALVDFAAAYARSELRVGSAREAMRTAVVTALVVGVLVGALLGRVLAADAPVLERSLAVAYPVLDVALLVPAVVVLRQTWHLRGGALWSCWMLLLAGIACLAVGDIVFAYFATLELTALDPVLDVMFVAGYLLLAAGTRVQRQALLG